jgi:CHAT domain-containing protein
MSQDHKTFNEKRIAFRGQAPIKGREEGIVTAYEISQLNLRNTELVVLSACGTALGDIKERKCIWFAKSFQTGRSKKLIG